MHAWANQQHAKKRTQLHSVQKSIRGLSSTSQRKEFDSTYKSTRELNTTTWRKGSTALGTEERTWAYQQHAKKTARLHLVQKGTRGLTISYKQTARLHCDVIPKLYMPCVHYVPCTVHGVPYQLKKWHPHFLNLILMWRKSIIQNITL